MMRAMYLPVHVLGRGTWLPRIFQPQVFVLPLPLTPCAALLNATHSGVA